MLTLLRQVVHTIPSRREIPQKDLKSMSNEKANNAEEEFEDEVYLLPR